MYVGSDFDVMDPTEIDFFTFDFVRDILTGETISSVSFTIEDMGEGIGTDPTPAARLLGSAVITGSKVTQTIATPVADVRYRLTAIIITSLGRDLHDWSHFWCRTPT